MVDCLLRANAKVADANASDLLGFKPIEIAAMENSDDIVQLLIPFTTPFEMVGDWTLEGIKEYFSRTEAATERAEKSDISIYWHGHLEMRLLKIVVFAWQGFGTKRPAGLKIMMWFELTYAQKVAFVPTRWELDTLALKDTKFFEVRM